MRAGDRALNGGAARSSVAGTALRRTTARAGSWIALAPVLIIAGVLAALAQVPWLLGMAAPPPDMSTAQLGLLDLSGEPTTGGPSYVARLRDFGSDPARLVKERRALRKRLAK